MSAKLIITFHNLILFLNNFIFNCSPHSAMGTICAQVYPNIFMAQFDVKHIYPFNHGKALLFQRYIDNIFMIWNRANEELVLFIDELNKKHKTIKFD